MFKPSLPSIYSPKIHLRYLLSIIFLTIIAFVSLPTHAGNFSCQFTFASEWGSGVIGNLQLTNSGSEVSEWEEITVQFPGVTASLQGGWNGEYAGSNPIVIRPSSWSSALQPNQSILLGMQLSKPAGASLPTPILGGDCASTNQSPVAALTIKNILESLVAFDATGSYDADGDELTYTWTVNGNIYSTSGNYLSHVNLSKGEHVITVTVSDGELSDTITKNFYMSYPPTSAPIAEFDYLVNDFAVDFDGSRSRAVGVFGVRIHSYYWDFGDGATGSGVNASHTYRTPGVYTVILRVYDSNMDTATKVQTVLVGDIPNEAPVAVMALDQSLHLVTLDARNSYDPDNNTLTYQWSIDGTVLTSSYAPYIANFPFGRGTHTVTLTVSDGRLSHSVSDTLVVTHPELPVANFEFSVDGTQVTFDGSSSAAFATGASITSYQWDFGDGSTQSGTSAEAAVVTHTYATPGTYAVTLTVEDTFFSTATTSSEVNLGTSTNSPPVINFSCVNTMLVGDAFELGLSATITTVRCINSSTDPDGDPLTFAWSWGDNSSVNPANYSHSYRENGSYTISLTASDGIHSSSSSITHTAIGNGLPPQVTLSCTATGFTATCSATATDPDGQALQYRVKWGDEQIDTLVDPADGFSYTFASEGEYAIRFYAADGQHLVSSAQTLVVGPTLSDPPAECSYLIGNTWGNMFQAKIRITNTSDSAIDGWNLHWAYSDGSTITQWWNAQLSGSGPYTATNLGWNAIIQPGETIEFGFQGTGSSQGNSHSSEPTNTDIPSVTGDICGN